MSGPTRRRDDGGRDPARFLTLLDAIVAIAGTLLVLPLVDAANDAAPDRPVPQVLHDNLGLLASFALSFAVILSSWRTHHRIFEPVRRLDPTLRLGSELWAFTIVVLPFPTRLIAVHHGSDRGIVVLYVGVLLVSSTLLAVLHRHVSGTPAVRRDDAGTVATADSGDRALVTPLVVAVALLLGALVPGVGFAGLGLLLVVPPLVRRWDDRRAEPARELRRRSRRPRRWRRTRRP